MLSADLQPELKITKEISPYYHFGEIKISKDSRNKYEREFWNLLKRYNKSYKQLDFETGKIFLGSKFFDEKFVEYFKTTKMQTIFESIRAYPYTIGKSYLSSNVFLTEDVFTIPFFVEMCGKIDLPKTLELGSLAVDAAEITKQTGAWQPFLEKHKIFFWSENTTYKPTKLPAKIGDLIYIKAKIYLKHNPKLVIRDFGEGKMILGINTYLPMIDQELVGAKISKQKRKFDFTYPKDSPGTWAGQEAVFEYTISDIHSPLHPSLESLFENGQVVDGYRSLAALEKELKKEYDIQWKETEFDLQTNLVAKKLLEIVPDFDFNTSDIRKMAKKQAIQLAETGKEDIISKLETDFGTFESNSDLSLEERIYQPQYQSEKLDKLLLYLFHYFGKEIANSLPDNPDETEELEEMADERSQNPQEYGYDEGTDKQYILMDLQKNENRHKAIIWLTQQALLGKVLKNKKTKL